MLALEAQRKAGPTHELRLVIADHECVSIPWWAVLDAHHFTVPTGSIILVESLVRDALVRTPCCEGRGALYRRSTRSVIVGTPTGHANTNSKAKKLKSKCGMPTQEIW